MKAIFWVLGRGGDGDVRSLTLVRGPSSRSLWITVTLFAFALGVYLVDVVVSSSISLVPLLAVPVVVSALFVGARVTIALSIVVIVLAVAASVENGALDQPSNWVSLGSLVVVCFLASATAGVRERLESTRRETLRALADSERKYRLLTENSSDVVYMVGPDRRVTWISPNVSESLGWSAEDMMGTKMYDLIHDEDRGRIDALREAVFGGQDIPNPAEGWPSRWRHKDGTYTWMTLKTTTIRGSDGQMASAVTGMRDVDALVREREIAESESARRAAILGTLLDPHVLLQAVRDEEGVVVDFTYADANEAACDYNLRSREDLIGARLLDVLPGHEGTGLLAMYAHTVDTGEPIVLDAFAYVHDVLGEERRYDMRAVRVGDRVSLTWRDVTERYQTSRQIAESEEHFRLLADNSSDVVVLLRDGVVQWISPALNSSLGWAPAEWEAHLVEEFTYPEDMSTITGLLGTVDGGSTQVATLRLRAKDGTPHWVEVHAGPFTNASGDQDGTVASFRVVDAEIDAQQTLSRRATYDDLTGALKRDPALQRLQEIGHRPRSPGSETGVLFIDVDDFKAVNDTLGHAAGDTLLKAMTERIRGAIRVDDSIARMGGDEFLVTLEAVHDLGDAVAVAEKLRQACAEPVPTPQGVTSTTVSIGVTLADPVETGDELVARADAAMYQAKRAGRNIVVAVPIGFR
jgi:diguanylate cyclase (GGDEF)-like protein/PAS domain S-box-containing protein